MRSENSILFWIAVDLQKGQNAKLKQVHSFVIQVCEKAMCIGQIDTNYARERAT